MLAGTWVATPEGAAVLALIVLTAIRELRTRASHLRAIEALRRTTGNRPAPSGDSDDDDDGGDGGELPELGTIYGAGRRP